jgi:ribosome assembly protein YihI (activator of Der GTPase)
LDLTLFAQWLSDAEYLEEQAGHLEQLSARPELVRQEVNGMRARVLRALLETENLSKESRRMVQEVLDSRVEALIELEERVDE